MKRITSFVFAAVSTTFLFAGATRAAEKFDYLAKPVIPTVAEKDEYAALPCIPCELDERIGGQTE